MSVMISMSFESAPAIVIRVVRGTLAIRYESESHFPLLCVVLVFPSRRP